MKKTTNRGVLPSVSEVCGDVSGDPDKLLVEVQGLYSLIALAALRGLEMTRKR